MVEDGVTGLLVKPGSPDQMAQKIIELLESPTLGLELTRNARRECRQFRWDTITSSLITAYQGIEYKAPDQVAANG
jgi:glycosyltransferase involved in cell wall biosynthesis